MVCGWWGLHVVHVVHGWGADFYRWAVCGHVLCGLGCGFVGVVVPCHVMSSLLAKSDGMSVGRVLTVVNNINNNNER